MPIIHRTHSVVAIFVESSVPTGVGAVGVPVKFGLNKGASAAKAELTNAVVAIFVEGMEH